MFLCIFFSRFLKQCQIGEYPVFSLFPILLAFGDWCHLVLFNLFQSLDVQYLRAYVMPIFFAKLYLAIVDIWNGSALATCRVLSSIDTSQAAKIFVNRSAQRPVVLLPTKKEDAEP